MLNSDSKTFLKILNLKMLWPNKGTKFRFFNLLMFLMNFLGLTDSIFYFLKHFSDLNSALN